MSKFIKNVNKYLSDLKIKQSYLCMITGMDKNKLSRLLTGAQEANSTDMEIISDGLGKNVEYFLSDQLCIPKIGNISVNKVAFYAGEPSIEQERIANKMTELIENVDEIVSAKTRFLSIAKD